MDSLMNYLSRSAWELLLQEKTERLKALAAAASPPDPVALWLDLLRQHRDHYQTYADDYRVQLVDYEAMLAAGTEQPSLLKTLRWCLPTLYKAEAIWAALQPLIDCDESADAWHGLDSALSMESPAYWWQVFFMPAPGWAHMEHVPVIHQFKNTLIQRYHHENGGD